MLCLLRHSGPRRTHALSHSHLCIHTRPCSSYCLPESERHQFDSIAPSSGTYGELTVRGAATVFRLLQPTGGDVLYDLGSGTGRFVLQAALTLPRVRVVGVELSATRHAAAIKAHQRVVGVHARGNLALRHADILTTPCSDATLVPHHPVPTTSSASHDAAHLSLSCLCNLCRCTIARAADLRRQPMLWLRPQPACGCDACSVAAFSHRRHAPGLCSRNAAILCYASPAGLVAA